MMGYGEEQDEAEKRGREFPPRPVTNKELKKFGSSVQSGISLAQLRQDLPALVGATAFERAPEAKEFQELNLDEIRRRIMARFPQLAETLSGGRQKTNFREMGMSGFRHERDPLIQAYLRRAGYHDLKKDGIVMERDEVERRTYLKPSDMWDIKIGKARGSHKAICERLKKKLSPMGRGNGGMNLERLMGVCRRVETNVKRAAGRQGLDSTFAHAVDADLLMSIAIHEVIPTDYNQSTRIALMRTLLDQGLELNKIPAIYDRVASFGPMQMTVGTYQTLPRSAFDLPARFEDCVDLDDQMAAGLVLSLENLRNFFTRRLAGNARFMEMWKEATRVSRRAFIAHLLGMAHNNPKFAIRTTEQALGWERKDSADYFLDNNPKTKEKITDLDELRISLFNINKRVHSISARHGYETGELVETFSHYDTNSIPGVPPAPSPSPDEPPIQPPVQPPEAPGQKIVRMFVREKEGREYYTYTIPDWKIERVLFTLCGKSDRPFVEYVRDFSGAGKFKPGSVVLVPTRFLRPELQAPELIEFEFPAGANPQDFIRKLVNGNEWKTDTAVLYSSASSIADLKDIIRLPKNLVEKAEPERVPAGEIREGDWEFGCSAEKMRMEVHDRHGRTLYHFIKGELRRRNLLPPNMSERDELAAVDAAIEFCRRENPSVNPDDFSALKGKMLNFPLKIFMKPRFGRFVEDYGRLQELAAADGFLVNARAKQWDIYRAAEKRGVSILDSPDYSRKEGISDGANKLEEDALRQFRLMARAFRERTQGFRLTYSDAMRDPEAQSKREGGSKSGSTHLTGRSLDIADGRFLAPNGKEITWSGNSEYRQKIEKEFRPLIQKLVAEFGAAGFVERGHFHLYFPKQRTMEW